mmetsp:Transcript_2778/g.6193  ORF Transcript_2778/g.6193 Transcript_2778/m.6193 type:complete len:114 (-) Transcript_2778:5415-5756(-)
MQQDQARGALEITDANFIATIQSNRPVLIDFWAAWCGPCQMLAPTVDELAKETSGKFVVGKLDVDQNPEMSKKYGIRSIPTLIIFKQGKELERLMGGQHTQASLKAKLVAHSY